MERKSVTLKGNTRRSRSISSFPVSYAHALLRRVERRLRKSAKNRARREYAAGYRMAANLIHHASV